MKETTENKILSEIRDGDVATIDDETLFHLIAFGKKDNEIIREFCKDLDSKPVFRTMLKIQPELCDDIVFAWQNALEANITDNHEARETNACPGSYDASKVITNKYF